MPVTAVVAGAGFGKSTLLAQACRADAVTAARDPALGLLRLAPRPGRRAGRRDRSTPLDVDQPPRPRSARRDHRRPCGATRRSTCASCSTTCTTSACEPSGCPAARRARALLPANAHLVLAPACPRRCRSPSCGPPTAPRARRARSHVHAAEVERLAAAARRSPADGARRSAAGRPWCAWPSPPAPASPSATPARRCSPDLDPDRPPRAARAGDRRDRRRGAVVAGSPAAPSTSSGSPRSSRWCAASTTPATRPTSCGSTPSGGPSTRPRPPPCSRRGDRRAARQPATSTGPATWRSRAGDATTFAAAAMELVRTTVSVLPVELAQRWLAAAAAAGLHGRRSPCACWPPRVRAATDFGDRSVDAVLDAVADELRAAGDGVDEVTALAIGTVAAQARGDTRPPRRPGPAHRRRARRRRAPDRPAGARAASPPSSPSPTATRAGRRGARRDPDRRAAGADRPVRPTAS